MSLRELALRSGGHVVGREIGGLVIRFAGALIVTRLIGPAAFGIYAGALAFVTLVTIAAQMGGEVYLIRREHEPSRRHYDEVFTFLLMTSFVAVGLAFLASVVVASLLESDSAVAAFQVLLLSVPLSALWAPAQARLERGFRFRALAFLQVASDAALYGVGATLALMGAGAWSLIVGTIASAALMLVGSCAIARYRPRIALSRARAREIGRFGMQFVPSPLLWSSGSLINPLIVGSLLGTASVGYVALATRLADAVSFALRATYRVSLVALSRAQSDAARLRRGFEEMLILAAIGVGVPLVALSIAAPPLLPVLFGDEWEPALEVLPFVSFGFLMLGFFNIHLALLYVLDRTLATSLVALVRVALLGFGSLLLVPAFELYGYGVAILLSTAAWALADRALRERVDFRYGRASRWLLVLTPPLFIPLLEMPWALLLLTPVAILLLVDRAGRAQLRGYLAFVRRNAGRAGPVAEPTDGVVVPGGAEDRS
jgi:PST family polysaccharide transporter